MEAYLRRGVQNHQSGEVVDLPKLLDFMWDTVRGTEGQRIGREIYHAVQLGEYADLIRFHHKNSSNHAYYEIR